MGHWNPVEFQWNQLIFHWNSIDIFYGVGVRNGLVPNGETKTFDKKTAVDTNANIPIQKPVPKSVAFEVLLDDRKTDSLIKKHPPMRIQKLEPLSLPVLTPEMLAEKQRLADEKRERELQKRASASRKKSQRRREILKAQEIAQDLQQKEVQQQFLTREKTVENLRSAKLAEIQEKQRLQEERRKRTRERAKKLNQEDQQEVGMLEVEKDDHYNADDADSWLNGDDNNNDNPSEPGDRVYNGRTSPSKNMNHRECPPSASTVDSFDNAYNRKTSGQNSCRTDNFTN
ncbi:unnamed protein product [Mytilus coruscus]|uniref:Uncharacterized protein n=1 Tax=Mytilus coruscus TaxID=42192 RepID=A0A6J8A8R3_MYTCO|nr:unnamed protein product [Mytilus coruscus]